MKRLAAALLILAVTAATAFAQPADLGATLAEAMDGKTVPAVGVLVIRDGKVEAQAQRGLRRIGEPGAVTADDRWNLGSDGKAMTATLIARLVEQGKLSWDAPVSSLIPELTADMRPEYRSVTLLELLSHRAGLPENTSDLAFFATFASDTRPPTEQRLAYLRRALAEAPIGPAGGEASYSNTGLLLAGAIAERATGKPFEQLMREEVFAPLGITSARFTQLPEPGQLSGHVDGRVADKDGDVNPPMFVPAGGVRMTLADWARFCIDQMDGEHGTGKLLTVDSYRLLHTGQGGTRFALGWGAADRAMGLQGPALTHAGSDGNWYALVVLFPQSRNGVLVVANAADSMGGDQAAVTVIRAVAATVAAPAPPAPAKP